MCIQRCPSTFDWSIGKISIGLWCVFFTTLRPAKKQSAVKVDNLVIQPLPRSQSDDVFILYCFSCKFGYLSPRFKKSLYSRFISRWKVRWKGEGFRLEILFKFGISLTPLLLQDIKSKCIKLERSSSGER